MGRAGSPAPRARPARLLDGAERTHGRVSGSVIERAQAIGERGIDGRQQVPVDVHGRADVLVSESFLDDVEVRRDGERQRRARMAKVVPA